MDPTQNQQKPTDTTQAMQQPAQQATDKQQVSQAPVVQPVISPFEPVSTPGKESGPVVSAPVGEYIKPTDSEPVLHPEVVKAGIEISPNHEQPSIPQDLQQAGVSHSGPTQQVNVSQQPSMQLPMQQAQATVVAKKKKWHESITWLAIYILRQLKIIQAEKKEV